MGMEDNERNALEELRVVCGERGIRIAKSHVVKDGDILYKRRLNTVFVGDYVNDRNIDCFLKVVSA